MATKPTDIRPTPPKDSGSGAKYAAAIAAAVLIASGIASKWEGYASKVYKDPAGIPTWCYGETEKLKKDPSYIYSKSECMGLLRQRLTEDYAPKIAQCMPAIVPNRFVFGALIDASYNAGWAGVCRSFASLVQTGQLQVACDKLPTWYITAQRRVNGKRVGQPFVLKGLVNRRKDERSICLMGVNHDPEAEGAVPAQVYLQVGGRWSDRQQGIRGGQPGALLQIEA